MYYRPALRANTSTTTITGSPKNNTNKMTEQEEDIPPVQLMANSKNNNEAVQLIQERRYDAAIDTLDEILLLSSGSQKSQRKDHLQEEDINDSSTTTTSSSIDHLQQEGTRSKYYNASAAEERSIIQEEGHTPARSFLILHPPDNEPHNYNEERYDEGMSAFSKPLCIHPGIRGLLVVDPTKVSVEPVVYFNLGIAYSRLNAPNSPLLASKFMQRSFDLLATNSNNTTTEVYFSKHGDKSKSFLPIPLIHIALLNIGHTHWAAGHHNKAGRIYRSLLPDSLLPPSSIKEEKSDASGGFRHGLVDESPAGAPTSTATSTRTSPLLGDDRHNRVATLSDLPSAGELAQQFKSAALNCVAVVELYALGQQSYQSEDICYRLGQNISYCLELLDTALSHWTGSSENTRQSATILNNIGRAHFISKQYRNALSSYETALQQRSILIGDDNLDVAATIANIAQCHEAMGDYPKAISYYERCWSVVSSRLEPGNEDFIRILVNLGDSYANNGNQERAKAVLTKALRHSKSSGVINKNNGLLTTMILNKLGNVNNDLNDNDAALECYVSGLELERQIYPNQQPHMNIAVTIMNIARIHKKMGSLDYSRNCLEEALQIANGAKGTYAGDFHSMGRVLVLLADIHSCLATTLEAQGDYPRAIQELERTLDIGEHILGPIHFQISVTLNSLALLQFKVGETHTALISMLRCLNIRRRTLVPAAAAAAGDDNPPPGRLGHIITAYHNCACLYKSIGENRRALHFFEIILALEQELKKSKSFLPVSGGGIGTAHEDTSNENINNSSSPPTCHNNVVETLTQIFLVHEELDEVQIGLKYLVHAAQICFENKDVIDAKRAFLVYKLVGDTYYFHMEEIKRAMKYYSSALRLFRWDGCESFFSSRSNQQTAWFCKRILTCYTTGAA